MRSRRLLHRPGFTLAALLGIGLFPAPVAAGKDSAGQAFGHAMTAAQEAIASSRHEVALERLEEAERALGPDAAIEDVAYLLDSRRYALYELGRVDEALATCREAIARIGEHTIWPYLHEHDVLRGTLRGAHNMLAWELAERATTPEQLREALEHVEACFEATSPIEDDDVLDPFHATRALVHLRFLPDPRHREIAYESLVRLKEIGSPELASVPALRQAVASEEFAAHAASRSGRRAQDGDDDDDEGDGDDD